MVNTLKDRSQKEWRRAIDSHLSSAFSAALCFAPSADWHEDATYTRFVSGAPEPFGNIIWNARLGYDTAASDIHQVLEPVVSRDLPAIWVAGPASEPADLIEHLSAHGLIAGPPLEAMAIDLSGVSTGGIREDVQIEEVCDDETMKAWTEVLAAGFELSAEAAAAFAFWPRHLGYSTRSHMRAFLARQEGRAVACSLLYLAEGLAGIYCLATVPEARRQGIGRAITESLLLEVRTAGYTTAVLQASAAGERVCRQIGFRSYGPIAMMVRVPNGAHTPSAVQRSTASIRPST